MLINDWLTQAAEQLKTAGVGTARLDCLVLLEDILHKNRTHLLAHPEIKLTDEQLKRLNRHVKRRCQHEPLAYIRGKTEFYGRQFGVDKRVLEPRPESETMIDLFKKLPAITHIIDIGCGSGALGITAHFSAPTAELTFIDIDPDCLKVTRANLKKHKIRAKVLHGNLLNPLSSVLLLDKAVLLANLPYVPTTYQINQAAFQEPKTAIFGGTDGLAVYRQLFDQISQRFTKHQAKPAYILTECLPFQHKALAKIAKSHHYQQLKEDDFIQLFSVELPTSP